MRPCDFHQLSEAVVIVSTNLAAAALPAEWGDVSGWDGDGGPAMSEVQVSVSAFGDVSLTNLEPFARTENGSCSFGLLASAVELSATSDVAASATDVDDTTDEFTLTAHTFYTGQLCRIATSNALPTGLEADTDYWIIVVDDNTVQLAASYEDALAETAIDITDAGTGNQTITGCDLCATYRMAHLQGTQEYGFVADAHAGSVPVRIAIQTVTRFQ